MVRKSRQHCKVESFVYRYGKKTNRKIAEFKNIVYICRHTKKLKFMFNKELKKQIAHLHTRLNNESNIISLQNERIGDLEFRLTNPQPFKKGMIKSGKYKGWVVVSCQIAWDWRIKTTRGWKTDLISTSGESITIFE